MARYPTYEEFETKVDQLITKKYGLGKDDFEDAKWRDCYEDSVRGVDLTDEQLMSYAEETLRDSDDTFSALGDIDASDLDDGDADFDF